MRRLVPIMMGVTALAACGDNAVSQPAAAPAVAATPAPAVAQSPASNAPVSPASSAAAAPGSVAAAVPEALAFKAPLVGGGELNLADYAGKPVLLWFWAPT